VFTERTSVGVDVHARSVAAAAIDGVTGELFQARLTPAHDHIRSWIGELPGPVAVTYEAGPTGFGLYRALVTAGIRCEDAAPSKLQRPAGDRVKSDLPRMQSTWPSCCGSTRSAAVLTQTEIDEGNRR
jgi:transposase